MRLSCNGCRVLRKGCSEDCCIRPSLQWIKSPEAQANATLFLAKFYGRAGLLNLLRTGPDHIRPSIFRSLLQEACGRIVNPVYGSSGLISTGNWHLCEAAVEAVLAGSPITQLPIESAVENISPVFKACDIRHVLKNEKGSPKELNKVKKRSRFKWSKPKSKKVQQAELVNELSVGDSVGQDDSGVTHSRASDLGSLEGVEDTLAKAGEVGLDLTLGFSHKVQQSMTASPESTERFDELTLGFI